MDGVTFRRAEVTDADVLADLLVEGFETYRSFAGDDFVPSGRLELGIGFTKRLAENGYWCLLAYDDAGAAVGEVAIMPASAHQVAVDDPALAHLSNLFVRPPWWGTGLASALHARAIAEATDRGCTAIRLFTPAEHGRARRFYEREGWSPAGEPFAEPHLGGLTLIAYRRPL